MTESDKDEELLSRVNITLDRAAEDIDGATRTRLRAIRREALVAGKAPYRNSWWVPVGSLATVATITIFTVSLWMTSPDDNVFMPPLEDIALLSDKEELEFYEQLDFYLWLEDEHLKKGLLGNEQKTG